MPFIHQRPGWPEFLWDDRRIVPRLGAIRHQQGMLLGKMLTLGFDVRSQTTLIALTNDVVKSSAIEGEILNPEEVRSSIARKLGLEVAGLVRSSRDVDGIVEMMLDATQGYDAPLTRDRLFGWHAALFPSGRSGLSRITTGAWRPPESGPMQIVSGPIGRERVHFEAPAGERVDSEMARFLEWFEGSPPIDPVLKAGIAHFWFETIHPFEDGNGRIGRAIADLMLARADGTRQRFYSLSSQIERERKDYYRELEETQRSGLDITSWLVWFLGCLGRAIDAAEDSLAAVLEKARTRRWIHAHPINERQRLVINRLLDEFQGKLTTSKYAKLAKCSEDTALRDINHLMERGILVRNPGGGRSASYRLGDTPPEPPEGGRRQG